MAKKKTGKAITPSKGLEAAYRKKLFALVDELQKNTNKTLGSIYKSNKKTLTREKNIIKAVSEEAFTKINLGEFNKNAEELAEWFVKRADSNTKIRLGKNIASVTGSTVKFKTTPEIELTLDSLLAENTSLIKSIPSQYINDVTVLVSQSVRAGRSLGDLTKELQERYDITKNRARTIARDQNNKATESINRERNKSLGITEGEWMHRSGSKQPRSSHQKAHGKRFKLDKGLLIDGEYIFPGQKINCNCSFRPVIPGLK